MSRIFIALENEKNIININGVYLDYDFKINTIDKGICYVNTNLSGNGVKPKNFINRDLHILNIRDIIYMVDILKCINNYNKYVTYKTIDYRDANNNIIRFIYVMHHRYCIQFAKKYTDLD